MTPPGEQKPAGFRGGKSTVTCCFPRFSGGNYEFSPDTFSVGVTHIFGWNWQKLPKIAKNCQKSAKNDTFCPPNVLTNSHLTCCFFEELMKQFPKGSKFAGQNSENSGKIPEISGKFDPQVTLSGTPKNTSFLKFTALWTIFDPKFPQNFFPREIPRKCTPKNTISDLKLSCSEPLRTKSTMWLANLRLGGEGARRLFRAFRTPLV